MPAGIGNIAPTRDIKPAWSEQDVRDQLNLVLGHSEFHATDKMRKFLRYVVNETLAGNAEHIKGFTLAVEVFGRDASFDAAHDPVVRIQAGRLRRAIERYYLVGGKNDLIRIDIPKGTYVPVFKKNPLCPPPPGIESSPIDRNKLTSTCPVVIVHPFTDLTSKPELAHMSAGLATELSIHLGHCPDLCVLKYREETINRGRHGLAADFSVEGSVQSDDRHIKIVAQLVNNQTGQLLWTEAFKAEFDRGNLIAFQERAASSITAHIAGDQGIIVRTMGIHNDRRPISQLTTYQAVLKGYTYWDKIEAQSYQQALESLELEKNNCTECGLVFTMLSLLYTDNIALEHFDLKQTPLEEAARLALEGNRLDPNSQMGYLALARVHMLKGNLDQARVEVDRALALHPESLLFIDAIGYLLIHLGDWDRGEELIRRSIRLNPFYRLYSRFGLWLNAFRQLDYAGALKQSEWLADIGSFWGPLCSTVTLENLGRAEEAGAGVQELMAYKPDFVQRGRVLIENYIKFPEISNQVIESLARAGLKVD